MGRAPEWQTVHRVRYDDAIGRLAERMLLYECYCSRRDIQQAPRAPHAPQGAYPGTCRDLSDVERQLRRDATGRPAALRLRADITSTPCTTCCTGITPASSTTLWSARGDGVPAYNLAVVVDDAAQGVDQVVRGDDLLPSSPRQAYLADVLGYPQPAYAHVALVLNHDGQRLAKRDGAVTLAEIGVERAIEQMSESSAGHHTTSRSCWRSSTRHDYRASHGFTTCRTVRVTLKLRRTCENRSTRQPISANFCTRRLEVDGGIACARRSASSRGTHGSQRTLTLDERALPYAKHGVSLYRHAHSRQNGAAMSSRDQARDRADRRIGPRRSIRGSGRPTE